MRQICALLDSCDKYSDCWLPWMECLQKFWSSCPYPVFLCTETKDAPSNIGYAGTLHCDRKTWSGLLLEACEKAASEFVLLFLEDQWLADYADSSLIDDAVDLIMKDGNIGVIYFDKPSISYSPFPPDDRFAEIAAGAPYRVSCGPSVWRTDYLCGILNPEESAWDFERIGSFRPEAAKKSVLTCVKPAYTRVIGTDGAIARGKWVPGIKAFAAKNGLHVDFSKRGEYSLKDKVQKAVKSFVYNLNPPLILKIQNWLYYRKKQKTADRSSE